MGSRLADADDDIVPVISKLGPAPAPEPFSRELLDLCQVPVTGSGETKTRPVMDIVTVPRHAAIPDHK